MSVESLSQAKAQAKALRAALAAQGTRVSHAQALEIVAHQNGARDWNTMHARLARAEPTPLQVNDRVSGHYLGQAFTARVVALSKVGRNLRVTLRLDAPVDTVRFDSFSNMRQQVSAVVGPDGRSTRKTSDGTPHLVITLPVNG